MVVLQPLSTAQPLAAVAELLNPYVLRLLRNRFGLPDYVAVLEMDKLPQSEWRRIMQEPPQGRDEP